MSRTNSANRSNQDHQTRIYRESDGDIANLKDQVIGVLGFGSHGRAHALNLTDSGIDVVVGLKADSSSRKAVTQAGLEVMLPVEAAAQADIIAFFVPDTVQKQVYAAIESELEPGNTLLFPHGFSILFNQIEPPDHVDVSLVAPKAPGELVRQTYESGQGTPGVFAVDQDATGTARERALAYAKAIGCLRAGVVETTFREETVTDLFGEQAILCGGLPSLIMAAYETLVDNGYSREMAYFECLNEVFFVVDLMFSGGFDASFGEASNTSEYGGLTRGGDVIDSGVYENLEGILDAVEDGSFASEWISENHAGAPKYNRLKDQLREHDIETVGSHIRESFTWSGIDPD